MKKETQKSSVKKVTLKELGNNMALGVEINGKYSKSYNFRPWKMKQEKKLGELGEENPDANMGEFVSMVISYMCTSIGTHKFEDMKSPEKRIIVSQMWMGDVFFLYLALRIKALGKILPLAFKCPNCKKDIEFKADLETVEVTTANNLKDLIWEYSLIEPLTVRGKEVTTLTMGPLRWNVVENLDAASAHMGVAKEQSILGSIQEVKELGGPVVLVEGDLDDLSKIDLETLSTKIEEEILGPDMSITDNCPRCKREFHKAIDWRYDNFFGVSSSQ